MQIKYLLLALLLTGCGPKYVTSICSKDQVGCQTGNQKFVSKEACEDFVRKAAQAQPNVSRICIEYVPEY